MNSDRTGEDDYGEAAADSVPEDSQPEACCDYKTLVAVFKALSDESRQKILLSLDQDGETRVSELVRRFDISQPTMSHHLGVLRQAGLVEDRRVGQSVYYAVNRQWLQRCCNDYLSRFQIEEN
jgi:DNA-binding transcriptional ArsR family regulator